MLGSEAAAVALNVALVAPAATVTEAGTVSEVLLLASVIAEPSAGAVWVSVTVQVPAAPGPSLAGLHASVDSSPGANRLTIAIVELPPRVAVTVAL